MVKVTVVQDDKKVFEREGKFFAGTTIIDSDKDIVDAYVVARGRAGMDDVILTLTKLTVGLVREVSLNWAENIIGLKALEKILHNHTVEKIQKIMED